MSTGKVGKTINPRDVVSPGYSQNKKSVQDLSPAFLEIKKVQEENTKLKSEIEQLKSKLNCYTTKCDTLTKNLVEISEQIKTILNRDSSLHTTIENLTDTVQEYIAENSIKLNKLEALNTPAKQEILPKKSGFFGVFK